MTQRPDDEPDEVDEPQPRRVPGDGAVAPARADRGRRTTPAQYAREVRAELRRVAWPSREDVVNYSTVVVITLVLLVGLIFALNLAFGKAISALFGT